MNEPPIFAGYVLIADAYPDAAESLAMLLRTQGLTSVTALDGSSALELAETHRPFAVVLALSLPKFDGYQVATRIRQTEWGRSILIVAFSGSADAAHIAVALRSGFDCFFTKPLENFQSFVQLLMSRVPRHTC